MSLAVDSHMPLPAMDRAARLQSLRASLAEHGIEAESTTARLDALWVTSPVDVRWLTGFTGSNGRLLVTDDEIVLFTDGRYGEQSTRELQHAGLDDVDVHLGVGDVGDQLAARLGAACLGFDESLSVRDHRQLADWLSDAGNGAELVLTDAVVAGLRQVKDVGERFRLERAASIADQALATMTPQLAPGVSERTFQLNLDRAMLDHGADALSFDSIVASGPNSALPHARPGERLFTEGDLVVIDFGASVDGYGSDMTRTFCIGEPTGEQQALYEAVAGAQAAGVAAVADGVAEREIDRVCRDHLAGHDLLQQNLADAFIHGTGHGIGLEIHEQPILSTRSVGILRAGLIITVEPGAYISGFGGVRVEDSVVVTADGAEPITHAPKGLVPTSGGA